MKTVIGRIKEWSAEFLEVRESLFFSLSLSFSLYRSISIS